MSIHHERQREELQNKLAELATKKMNAEQANLLAKFIPHFLASVSLEELLSRDIHDLFGAVKTEWELVFQRAPGETKLKIFNPRIDEHGWQSPHTVIALAHDDMPFLVDSIQMELNRRLITTHIIFHAGGINIQRDAQHRVTEIYPMGVSHSGCLTEAVIYIEIDRQSDNNVLEDIYNSLQHILRDVELAVEDWRPMREEVQEAIVGIQKNPPPLDSKEIAETCDFLQWLLNDHFIFLGYREYQLIENKGERVLQAVANSDLGVLREVEGKKARPISSMTPEAQQMALSAHLLIIAKSNTISTVHRAGDLDIIGIKQFNEKGEVIGERRLVGLYTSVAYHSRPYNIPLLREKVREVMVRSRLSQFGHAGKALLNILETLPRDDLFQANAEDLLDLAMGILYMQDRREIRLFVRKDIYGRFLSCLVYVPKDRYSTELREKFQEVLVKAFDAEEIGYNTLVSDSVLARIHFMVRIQPRQNMDFDVKAIEQELAEVARSWQEDLRDELLAYFGEGRFKDFIHYLKAFPAGYRETSGARTAVHDIQQIESLRMPHAIAMTLSSSIEDNRQILRFKLYRKHEPVSLSDALPMLENMGLCVLSEEPFKISLPHNEYAWISEFRMTSRFDDAINIEQVRGIFQDAFARIWHNEAENDGFNRLVLGAQLTWQQIAVLRAYAKYFKQIRFTFSQNYIEETLAKYPHIAALLVNFFNLRFDPHYAGDRTRQTATDDAEQAIITALDHVTNLDEDRILRRYLEIMKATLRTNYFQHQVDGKIKPYISFKLNPALITDLPLPKPMFEIWVYSTRVEGVHLRSSKVARGGLRWSDRREDFRTEVLGLMKAQKVKNAVIVPSGAKGGFVPKCLPVNGTRDEIMQEGIDSYRMFIRGLLDITDNLIGSEVVPPVDVIRYDENDTYLVVAADKGTATFSNFANEIAAEYGFWLDDAFASGGATGYDHKKMGITARGAWESTKRHFRELGLNTQAEDFTVVGIGDLAGDVFGNGMLQSKHIKLLAAFNHMHIFIDPNPDPKKSFEERARMFNLPRSSWEDYNTEVISQGGGIFKRSLKSVPISAEMKAVFGITKDAMEPNELIRALLTAKIDLLWNGGIGTFVKAASEINEQVGDKNNDAIRINGRDLNCRVVVEGGNLGFTQLGRVEFALNGGQIYTDFIDNSAGVDCSDHEVNVKILLNGIVANHEMTLPQRNELLAAMTDNVAELVLRDNYLQTQAISMANRQALSNHDLYVRFMEELSTAGVLDRDIEFLPDDKQLQERKSQHKTLTAPEIAVLLAYSKMQLKDQILQSDVPEDSYLADITATAFPTEISRQYRQAMLNHSLRREIVATQLSNAIVNYMGITFVNRVQEETGATIAAIVRAYTIASEVFNAHGLWQAIEALDYQISSDVQYQMMQAVTRLVRRATRWFLRNHRNNLHDIPYVVNLYRGEVEFLYENMHELLSGAVREYLQKFTQEYLDAHVPPKLASKTAITIAMFSSLDIIAASIEHKFNPKHVAKLYFKLGAQLELGWLRASIISQTEESHWDALGKAALRDDIDLQQRELVTAIMLLTHDPANAEFAVQQWLEQNGALIERWERVLLGLKSTNAIEFVMYAVAIRELFELTQASKQLVKETQHA
jgi:glutamate dehydrogenase